MIALPEWVSGDHADFSADSVGVIGDSADKRFTYVRTDYKQTGRPEYVFEIDWSHSPFVDFAKAQP